MGVVDLRPLTADSPSRVTSRTVASRCDGLLLMRFRPLAVRLSQIGRRGANPAIDLKSRRSSAALALRRSRAEVAKLKGESRKLELEQSKLRVETTKSTLETARLAAVLAVVLYGVLALFCYCFFVAHFFPSGVSTGDTLLFAFIALALGVLGFMFSGLGMMVYLPWMLPGSKAGESKLSAWARRFSPSWWAASALYGGVSILMAVLLRDSSVSAGQRWLGPLAERLPWWSFYVVWAPQIVGAWVLTVGRGFDWLLSIPLALAPSMAALGCAIIAARPRGEIFVLACLVGGLVAVLLLAAVDSPNGAKAPATGSEKEPVIARTPLGLLAILGAAALLAPVAIVAAHDSKSNEIGISSIVFGQLGIYAQDAAMHVSAENLETLRSAASLADLPLAV